MATPTLSLREFGDLCSLRSSRRVSLEDFQKVEHRTEGILWQKRMGWQQDSYAWGYPSYFRRSLESRTHGALMLNQKPIEKLTQALDREFRQPI